MVYIVYRFNRKNERNGSNGIWNEIRNIKWRINGKAIVWLLPNVYSDLLRELQNDLANCKVKWGIHKVNRGKVECAIILTTNELI